jgi:ribosome-binding factor A
MGVQVERIVPIGHVKELERIPENVNKDIDVLFYGLMNERREAIVSDLRDRGLNVVVSTNLFGENRDLLISRSKVVLNVHYYEAKVLEMVRISYLLTNGCVVVSEVGVESDLESALTNAVAFAEYDKIVETCVRLSRSREVRDEFSKNARKAMRARPQLAFIRDLLEEERI